MPVDMSWAPVPPTPSIPPTHAMLPTPHHHYFGPTTFPPMMPEVQYNFAARGFLPALSHAASPHPAQQPYSPNEYTHNHNSPPDANSPESPYMVSKKQCHMTVMWWVNQQALSWFWTSLRPSHPLSASPTPFLLLPHPLTHSLSPSLPHPSYHRCPPRMHQCSSTTHRARGTPTPSIPPCTPTSNTPTLQV